MGSSAPDAIPFNQWEPAPGVQFLVDTKEAVGYLINQNGAYTAVPVLLGQNKTVHYLGRTYLATTPEDSWIMKSKHIQSDRITFGREGTFLRLYRDGVTSTPYGIHSHRYFEYMLAEGNPYRSMGCILVSQEVLDKIERAYELNGETLNVVTVYGIDNSLLTDLDAPSAASPEDSESIIKSAATLLRPASVKG